MAQSVSQDIVKELYLNVFKQNAARVNNIISNLKDKTQIKSWQMEFDDATSNNFLNKQADLDTQTLLWINQRIGVQPVVRNPALASVAHAYWKPTSVFLLSLFSKVTSNEYRLNELPAESRQLNYGKFGKTVSILQRKCKLKMCDEMYSMIGNRFGKYSDNMLPFVQLFDLRGIEINLLARFAYGGDNFISESNSRSNANWKFDNDIGKWVEAFVANGADLWPLSLCISDKTLLKSPTLDSKTMDSLIDLLIERDWDGLNLARLLTIDKNCEKVVGSMEMEDANDKSHEWLALVKWFNGLDRNDSKIDVFLKRLFSGKRRYVMMQQGKWMFLKGVHKRKGKKQRNCILTKLNKDVVAVIFSFAFPFNL